MPGQMLLSLHGVLKPINIAPLNARNGQAIKRLMYLLKWARWPRAVSGVAAHGQLFAPPAAERQSSAGSAAPGECGLRRQEKRCLHVLRRLASW